MPHRSTHLRRTILAAGVTCAAIIATAAVPMSPPFANATLAADPTATPLGPCVITTTRRVEPLVVQLGGTVDVTLTVRASCPIELFPFHLVFVLDDSSDMAGPDGRDVRRELQRMILDMTPNERTDLRVGIVGYNTRPTVVCAPQRDRRAAVRCLQRMVARGTARSDVGLDRARAVLAAMRLQYADRDNVREVVIFVARLPRAESDCDRAQSAAARLRREGVLVLSACVGDDCDANCMLHLGTSPRYFIPWTSAGLFGRILGGLFAPSRVSWITLQLMSLDIGETLPTSVTLDRMSAQPEPSYVLPGPTRIVWRYTHIPKDGITMTYRVRADATGALTVPETGRGQFSDSKNRVGQFDVPGVSIDVRP